MLTPILVNVGCGLEVLYFMCIFDIFGALLFFRSKNRTSMSKMSNLNISEHIQKK